MGTVDFHRIGSFQFGLHFHSEEPRAQAWAHVARLATADHVAELYKPATGSEEARKIPEYATARIRQAIEFREAAQSATLLTRPLPLYYSFMNLTRGFLALREDKISRRNHGVRFRGASDILDAAVTFEDRGTCREFLNCYQWPHGGDQQVTLRECLSEIVEVHGIFDSPRRGMSRVIPVKVEAMMSGPVTLEFVGRHRLAIDKFREDWTRLFPQLSDCCDLEPEGRKLRVRPTVDTASVEAVATFCHEKLLTNLVESDVPTWYAVCHHENGTPLPRPANYLVAMFILSSIVRYEPEAMLDLLRSGSELGWFLRQFLDAGDRFFPQLLLSWVWRKQHYF